VATRTVKKSGRQRTDINIFDDSGKYNGLAEEDLGRLDSVLMETFRDRMRRAFRKYRAIYILLNSASAEERWQLDASLRNIDRMSGPELRRKARDFANALKDVITMYGVKGSPEAFDEVMAEVEKGTRPVLYVSRFDIDRLFKHYDRLFPQILKLPPHGRVGIDIGGTRPDRTKMELFLLEASLFEDVAALWNSSVDATAVADQSTSTTEEVKQAGALRRATAKAAFNLLEGYLNGLALDVQLLFDLPAAVTAKLEEWDEKRNKPLRLSLREKILQYVKYASGLQHPPLQETNAPEMSRVLLAEERVRHALIHPTPRAIVTDKDNREVTYLNLTLDEVRSICDDVIVLIRRISDTVGPNYGTTDWWIFDKEENGKYPSQAFV